MLLRRRQVWLPTIWGWLALLLVSGSLSLAVGRSANRWLSVDEPARGADGRGARTLVVEGWMGANDLDQAMQAFRHGRYLRLLTTGGPTYEWPDPRGFKNYADRAADYLGRQGLPAGQVIAVPAPASAQDRTFLSAVMVRDWAAETGTRLDAIDVYSVGPHTRRSRMLYEMAFGPAVEVGALAARPSEFDADRWWSSSAGAKSMLVEAVSIAWTVCCFWPAARGSHEERWAVPPGPTGAASSSVPTPAPAPSSSSSQSPSSAQSPSPSPSPLQSRARSRAQAP